MRSPPRACAVLLALAACGPKPGATDSDGSTSGASMTGASDTTATSGEPTGSTSPGATTSPDPTTAAATTTAATTSTSGPGDPLCELVGGSQASCEAEPQCMAVVGAPLDFDGCTEEPAYLGCIDAGRCDLVETIVCKDGTEGVFRLPNGCVPPGFTPCPSDLPDCDAPSVCETLGEADCAAQGCTPVFGAPHIFQNGIMCADFMNQEFLGCLDGMISCPPFVVSVCPDALPEPVFDVALGCVPPGFGPCGEALPECQ